MKSLPALIATMLLGLGVCSCGGAGADSASKGTSSSGIPVQTSDTSTVNNDRDDDGDHNDDDQLVLGFGHVAYPAEDQAITTLVKRYYADAAAEDGRRACALLAPFIAESVVENYGHTAGLRGSSCTVVMAKLFKQHHSELVSKSATLKVMRVGVEEDKSLVAIEFPTVPVVRQITARRVGNTWTMLTLLDDNLE